jgi:hypothetical protein
MAKAKLFVKTHSSGLEPMSKLGVTQLSDRVETEVQEMSITPRTFVSRTFNESILDNGKTTLDLDDYWYIDEYILHRFVKPKFCILLDLSQIIQHNKKMLECCIRGIGVIDGCYTKAQNPADIFLKL